LLKTNRIAIVCYVYNHLELMALAKALKVSPEWLLDEELFERIYRKL
jgi:hypothetical protein